MKKKMNLALLLIMLVTVTVMVQKFNNRDLHISTPLDEFINDSSFDDDIIDEISFDEGVVIEEIEEVGSDLLAIGSKNDIPYMQLITSSDNIIAMEVAEYNGKIIDVEDKDHYFVAHILNSDEELIKRSFFVSNDEIIPFYKEQLTMNYSKGVVIKPKYLVIHETANTAIGADANAHWRYWSKNPTAEASTHFVVDSTQIYQMLELNQMGWHVGDNKYGYSDIYNTNSIGMEVAVNADGDFAKARQNAIDLTIKLMKELDMNITQLKRHNDASGKYCPINMLSRPDLWEDFIHQVELGLHK